MTIGPYTVLRPLGEGGMARVFLCRDRRGGAEVAVKVLHPDFISSPSARARFEREIEMLGQVAQDDPHLVPILDSGTDEQGVPYLVMPFVDGVTLAEFVATHMHLGIPVRIADAVYITVEVLHGLASLEAIGVAHRDVKPSNIFLSRRGWVRLGDLGTAKPSLGGEKGITTFGQWVCTPHWAAPEQFGPGPFDSRTDIYAVGCVLYYMLTGRPPILPGANDHATMINVAAQEYPQPNEGRNRLPLIQAIFAKNEEDWTDYENEIADELATRIGAINVIVERLKAKDLTKRPQAISQAIDTVVSSWEPGSAKAPRALAHSIALVIETRNIKEREEAVPEPILHEHSQPISTKSAFDRPTVAATPLPMSGGNDRPTVLVPDGSSIHNLPTRVGETDPRKTRIK